MKKIVPFKKEIIFKTNLSEVTSISLENTLKIEDNVVSGDFIVSGDYKVTDNSVDVENFLYELPFSIAFDSKYKLDNASVDIDDFYYEIINNSILSINIEVLIDKIEEKLIEEEVIMDSVREVEEEQRCVEEEDEVMEDNVEKIEVEESNVDISLFNTIDIEDSYKSYKVYIVRENDTLESILEKYNVTKDDLDSYNDLSEIKLGNKIIIPITNEGN